MDWTTRMMTVYEPEHCPRRYDYWLTGFILGILIAILF